MRATHHACDAISCAPLSPSRAQSEIEVGRGRVRERESDTTIRRRESPDYCYFCHVLAIHCALTHTHPRIYAFFRRIHVCRLRLYVRGERGLDTESQLELVNWSGSRASRKVECVVELCELDGFSEIDKCHRAIPQERSDREQIPTVILRISEQQCP